MSVVRRREGAVWAARCAICAVCAIWMMGAAAAGALEVPFLTGRVNDLAALLNVEEIQRLEAKLAAEEQRSGAQVALLTIPSLEGEALEDYSMRVAQTWKLGKAKNDNGVLFLVARDDRKMRIEVGYGLEGVLTDLATGRILDHLVRPLFREGKFGAGIEAGVDSILGILQGGEPPAEPAPSAVTGDWAGRLFGFGMYLVVCGVFSMLALFTSGRQSWILYFFLMPFHLMFPIILHPMLGPALLVAWIVGFPIAKAIVKKSGGGAKAPGCLAMPTGTGAVGSGGWINSGGWHSGGGGWSSGGGGGGFSGGGGSFGGGGSSGSW